MPVAAFLYALNRDPISASFLIAVLAVGALSIVTRREDAIALSGYLIFAWAISKVLAHFYGWPTAHRFYPFTDLMGMGIVMTAWFRRPEAWKLGIGFALLTKTFLHARFWILHDWFPALNPYTNEGIHNYILSLNILYAIEILCVAIAGGGVVRGYLRDWLSAGGAGHNGLRAQSRRHPSAKT